MKICALPSLLNGDTVAVGIPTPHCSDAPPEGIPGIGFTVTVTLLDVAEHPAALVAVTLYAVVVDGATFTL